MAVYKSVYCSPFSENIDLSSIFPHYDVNGTWYAGSAINFSCRVDTSNKNVIGYSIQVFDDIGNEVFSSGTVSPISELPRNVADPGVNSGVNGTYLEIPLFQDSKNPITASANALYCGPTSLYTDYFSVDMIMASAFPSRLDGESEAAVRPDNINDWAWSSPDLYPNGWAWDGKINGIAVNSGHLIAAYVGGAWHLFRLNGFRNGLTMVSANIAEASRTHAVCVKYGSHAGVYALYPETGIPNYLSGFWFKVNGGEPLDRTFIMDGRRYSWTITLYQGPDPDTVSGLEGTWYSSVLQRDVHYLDPARIPETWFDMSLTQGTILGSNGTRIQLSDVSGTKLIGDGLDAPPVLVNKFVQLGYFGSATMTPEEREKTTPFFVIRTDTNVRTYDQSLGHIYIEDGLIDGRTFVYGRQTQSYGPDRPLYNSCFFYKYSTDEAKLYNRDIVDYAFSSNIDLESPSSSLSQNTRILLMGQDNAADNGVWVYAGTLRDEKYYTRAADYDSWGEYIGRVIYARNTQVNYENSASAGGTLGSTSLYFYDQLPIQLFPLEGTELHISSIFMARLTSNSTILGWGTSHTEITDELPVTLLHGSLEGDSYALILNYYATGGRPVQGYMGYVILHVIYENGSYKWDSVGEAVNNADYFTFADNLGQRYGKERVEAGWASFEHYVGNEIQYPSIDWYFRNAFIYSQPYRGVILKNSVSSTYVSPNTGITPGQILSFLGGKYAHGADDKKIRMLRIDSIDKKFWRITHQTLDQTYGTLNSYDDGAGSPFKYEILSCFTTGDENPCTDYATPTITIQGVEPSGILTNQSSLDLQGAYSQGQSKSWESYRFLLKDSEGAILQDTGVKYDKTMKTCFVGLEDGSLYFISLITTDDIGYRLTYTVPVYTASSDAAREYPGSVDASGNPTDLFTARMDCATHSVILTYNGESLPSFEHGTLSIYRREYGIFSQKKCNEAGFEYREWYGPWSPIAVNFEERAIRDYNISQNHSYQYAIFPKDLSYKKLFANKTFLNTNFQARTGILSNPYEDFVVKTSSGSSSYENLQVSMFQRNTGKSVAVHWDEWSITELIPEDPAIVSDQGTIEEIPAIKKKYRVDPNNIWFFRFDVDAGSQNQNIEHGEIQTLGRYNKTSQSARNFTSGSVSCYLGSEMAPYSRIGYTERTRSAIFTPTSTNEATGMLKRWKELVHSANPKLLVDRKGQKWIVQITASSSTPVDSFIGTPTKISFDWREIDTCEDSVTIYGYMDEIVKLDAKPEWKIIDDWDSIV